MQCYKVSTEHLTHFLIRSILITEFLVLLWGIIYPITFPESFSCHSQRTTNNSTEKTSNFNSNDIRLPLQEPIGQIKDNLRDFPFYNDCVDPRRFLGRAHTPLPQVEKRGFH